MKYFLASVGNAELFEKVNGKLQLFASARTLTDSTLSFTSTMEEVRAGQGAQLYGRFNHDTGMTVALTEAMFNLKYISAQIGAEIQEAGTSLIADPAATVTADAITVSGVPQTIGEGCGMDKIVIWYKAKSCVGTADMQAFEVERIEETNSYKRADDLPFPLVEGLADTDYCVSYFTQSAGARTAKVKANFNPKELVLILTANLFAGDASHPETGKPVGSIVVKIPRFQLDGTFDLSLAMSSAATVAMNGTALVTESGDCEGSGIYAEIVEVINDRTNLPYAIVFENAEDYNAHTDLHQYDVLSVYGIYEDGRVAEIDSSDVTFDAGNTGAVITVNGVVTTAPSTAGSITATLKDKTSVVATLVLA